MSGNARGSGEDSFTADDFPPPEQADNDTHESMQWFYNATKDSSSYLRGSRSRAAVAQRAVGEINSFEKITGRKLTFTEKESIAYWSARELDLGFWGFPLGMVGGLSLAYMTRKSFRFPFWRPGAAFNPNVFKIGGRTILQDQLARRFYHGMRGVAYGALFGPLTGLVFTVSYATMVTVRGRRSDPRLDGVRRDGQQRMQEYMAARQAQQAGTMMVGPQQQQPQQQQQGFSMDGAIGQARARQVMGKYNDAYTEQRRSAPDPYSPQSGGDFPQDSAAESSTYDNPSDTYSPRGDAYQSSGRTQQYSPPQSNHPTEPRQPPDDGQGSGFFDDETYDAASPTARYPPREAPQPRKSSNSASSSSSNLPPSSGVSAWDRLRSGEERGNSAARTDNRRFPSRAPDDSNNGSFSRAEEDAQLAKTQAQRDFDASIERERRGGDF